MNSIKYSLTAPRCTNDILDIPEVNSRESTETEIRHVNFEALLDFNDDAVPSQRFDTDCKINDLILDNLEHDLYPSIQLCCLKEVSDFESVTGSQPVDGDIRTRNKKLTTALKSNNGRRQLRPIPTGWHLEIQAWRLMHPNADDFLDLLEEMCILAERGDGVLHMPPVVLDGPPGAGKSVLTEAVAAVFSGGYVRVAMAGMEMGSEFAGSDPGWGQTRIGKVFSTLSAGEFGNPIFLLDEIDKTMGSERYSPWAPLHDLLEPACAKVFRDRSFDAIAINAAHIVWVATSNDFSAVPPAIQDRFTVIHMPLPNEDQLAAVVRSVWKKVQVTHSVCAGFTLECQVAFKTFHSTASKSFQVISRI